LQFDGTDAGKRFIEAWKRARIIVDTGGGTQRHTAHAADSARGTGQIKSFLEKAKRPSETEAAYFNFGIIR
jgi:hypothetical protein